MAQNILLIEDDLSICQLLVETLNGSGFEVLYALTGTEGVRLFEQGTFDLVLLDIMLPGKSGEEVLSFIRSRADTPVIILSAKGRVSTKVDFLKLGADDYITKPFDLSEVVARIEAQLRRCALGNEPFAVMRYKDIVLNSLSKRATVNGVDIDLTAKEYRLLELLIGHKGKVFTKANLYESIWGDAYLGDDNAIKTHISNLRSKLKAANGCSAYIETVWGLGYRLYKE